MLAVSRAHAVGMVLACCATLPAQVTLVPTSTGVVRIHNTDMAVLEAGDPRQDLPCTVTPNKPLVGFDLRFHSGYDVSVPLKELAGSENLLTILFRVVPEHHPDEPMYFVQRVRVPSIEEDAKGDALLQGYFDIGEGKYHLDWLMRDRAERVCSSSWDFEASLPTRDRNMSLVIAPGVIQAGEFEQFREEPPVERSGEEQLTVKVLLNFAPRRRNAAMMQPIDSSALVSILRTISREPKFGKFSLVAFNLNERRVVYRQDKADRLDFPALGEALKSLSLGTVSLQHLADKNGDTQFLAELIRGEVNGAEHPDALIFAGPKVFLEENVPQEDLKQLGELDYPVFYMNYNLTPQNSPWRDAIGHAVKLFKGYEYTISRPRDLWFAVSEMVSRIVKSRNNRGTSASSQ